VSDTFSSGEGSEFFALRQVQTDAIGCPTRHLMQNCAMALALRAFVTVDVERPAKVVLELTLSEAIEDPLIATLNEADGVNRRAFAQLLQSAARVFEKCVANANNSKRPRHGAENSDD
jgi:hypothetical protein